MAGVGSIVTTGTRLGARARADLCVGTWGCTQLRLALRDPLF